MTAIISVVVIQFTIIVTAKCTFAVPEIDFLGHHVTSIGLRSFILFTDHVNVTSVKEDALV